MRLYIVFLFLQVSSGIYTQPVVKFTSYEELKSLFKHKNFTYIVERTTLIDDLANTEKDAVGVCIHVESAFEQYVRYMKKPTCVAYLPSLKNEKLQIFTLLLKDAPEILNEVKTLEKLESISTQEQEEIFKDFNAE